MNLLHIYHGSIPDFIRVISDTGPVRRLEGIGMNCGCEYTGFSGFRSIGSYTRFEHSVGTALAVWHFTGDVRQSVSALLHDVATPAFAHVIDFLHGDHVKQESTEERTLDIIESSDELVRAIADFGLSPEDVCDYHIFPIADNDTPKLSSDRLEYTLGNMVNFRFASEATASGLYSDLASGINEYGEPELVFIHKDRASEFAGLSLRCSRVYSSDADRYAMQRLAELIGECIRTGVIEEDDLYRTEKDVLEKMKRDSSVWRTWLSFRAMSHIRRGDDGQEPRIIQAKKRHIDPFVAGIGRVTSYDKAYRKELSDYLATDFDYPISL